MESPEGGSYSTAYERLVNNDVDGSADVVGLLAYAFYKRDKRELAKSGELDSSGLRDHHRILTTHLVNQYRDASLRSLETVAAEVVTKATPEIQEATRIEAVQLAKNEILRELRSVGSPWWSILWNVLGWFITLAITFLVAVGSGAVNLTIAPR